MAKFFRKVCRSRAFTVILVIIGIVPSVIVTEMVIVNYEDHAPIGAEHGPKISADIICNQLIKQNYHGMITRSDGERTAQYC